MSFPSATYAQQGAGVGFSIREMVDCEHSSRSDGDRSSAILNIRIDAKTVGVVAVLVAGGDHLSARACVI